MHKNTPAPRQIDTQVEKGPFFGWDHYVYSFQCNLVALLVRSFHNH